MAMLVVAALSFLPGSFADRGLASDLAAASLLLSVWYDWIAS